MNTELQLQRKQTLAFITGDGNPVEIVFDRQIVVKTPTGGYKKDPDADPTPQTMKWVRAGLPQTTQTPTTGGLATRTTDMLVARWDADIVVGDTFTDEGQEYEVTEISETPYRKVASVLLRANRAP